MKATPRSRFSLLALLCFLLCIALPDGALADTTVGTPISRLPYRITKPGKYRLVKNLTLPATSSAATAIQMTVPDVVLDLNGFSMSGPRAGGASEGIFLSDRSTVRNGTIHGFQTAVNSNGGINTVIEDLTIVEPSSIGIVTSSFGNIRRCRVIIGTYFAPEPGSFLIGVSAGSASLVEGCQVTLTAASGGQLRGFSLGSGGVARECIARDNTTTSGPNRSGFYFSVGVAATRLVDCSTYGFTYGYEGTGFYYDRCFATFTTAGAKNGGTSGPGNNF